MEVIITPQAQKQYHHLPSTEQDKIKKKLKALQNFPLSDKKLAGQFKDLRSLKAWPYRIIYYLSKKNLFVVSILHRQGAYK